MVTRRNIRALAAISVGLLVAIPASAKGGGRGGGGGSRAHSANDQRSNSLNPNNPAYQSSLDNRSNQLNPNNDAYYSSRGLDRPTESGGSFPAADSAASTQASLPMNASPPAGVSPPAGTYGLASQRPSVASAAPTQSDRPVVAKRSSWPHLLGRVGLAVLGMFLATYLAMAAFVRARRPF